jgi:hypothetical protein
MPTRPCLLLLTVLTLSGCAGNSVLTPYPLRAGGYTHALATATLPAAIEEARKVKRGRDSVLARLEEGRLAQLQGDATASRAAFAEADRLERLEADKATLSVSQTASQGLSLVSNDNVITYRPPVYEQIFLHTYQALNYLSANDREGARVEMRQVQTLQDKARDQHDDKDTAQPLPPASLAHYSGETANLNDLAARTGSASQNAWSLYLSAVLYEAAGQWDDAYIDYKRALALTPEQPVLAQEVARLAARLNRREDFSQLKLPNPAPAARANEGAVVVLFEEGLAPPRQELFLPFPWPEAWYVLAIPYYPQPWQVSTPLRLESGALKQPVLTQPVTDVQALAARALKDRLPTLLLRQTLRAQTKHRMQEQSADKGGSLLGVLVGAWNLISEQADLRSWLTLPRYAHIARFTLPEGEQEIRLNGVTSVKLTVNRQRLTLLRVVQVDNQYYAASWPL